MALQKTLTITNSFGDSKEFETAYVKITSLVGDKNRIVARYNIYEEADGLDLGNDQVIYTPDLDGSNFIAQAYEHLKTLPEFADAEDV